MLTWRTLAQESHYVMDRIKALQHNQHGSTAAQDVFLFSTAEYTNMLQEGGVVYIATGVELSVSLAISLGFSSLKNWHSW